MIEKLGMWMGGIALLLVGGVIIKMLYKFIQEKEWVVVTLLSTLLLAMGGLGLIMAEVLLGA